MIHELYQRAMAKGYRRCEASWTLEDNRAMNHVIAAGGAEHYKTYRIYQKEISTGPYRVLVTGATGFLGSQGAPVFVKTGYQVLSGVRARSDPRWISDLDVGLVPLDLGDGPEDLPLAVEDVDLVVHAAGITRARRAEDYRSVNAEGTRRLAAAALEAGVRRFVLISSLAARGPDDSTKDGRDHPESLYGRSKLEAEKHLRSLGDGMEAVALRPSGVYGPRDTDLLPLFKMASAGWLPVPSGAGSLQPVYAEDVAQAALAAAR